jgi:hypothetical protein
VIPVGPDAAVRFNPPPGWVVPAGFDPRRGHLADPAWPSAPEGWAFWVPDATLGRESVQGSLPSATLPRGKVEPRERRRVVIALACVAVVAILGFWGASAGDDDVSTGAGSCWTDAGGDQVEAVSCDSSRAAYVVDEVVGTPGQCSASYIEYEGSILCMHDRS